MSKLFQQVKNVAHYSCYFAFKHTFFFLRVIFIFIIFVSSGSLACVPVCQVQTF